MPFTTKVEHFEPYDRLSPAKLSSEYASKSVLISGGGYGIGASIARSFAEAHVASIIIAGRTESKLKATADGLKATYPETKVEYRVVDITSEKSVKALFASITIPLDILVNNAGYLSNPENFVHADLKEWWQSFEVNVLGTAMVTQQFLQARAKQNAEEQAVVINLNSIAAYNVLLPNLLSAYVGSKAAMWRMMETISMDVLDQQVLPGGARFISIHPGAVKTDMYWKAGLDGVVQIEATDPQLAAEFVVWSASQEAAFLANRMVWVNWDVDELVARKDEIVEKDMFRTAMS
jgi:NAD(P)-dependent dehydrogenase (short-subunit alcohol dehydrogenase family)